LKELFIFKFDGNTFTIHEQIYAYNWKRDGFLFNMMSGKILVSIPSRSSSTPFAPVTERIFSVIMDGFIAHLGAVVDKSRKGGGEGKVILPNLITTAISSLKSALQYTREPVENWEKAHKLAKDARKLLTRPVQQASQADAEKRGSEGLRLLSER
jgi:hypothetical protein